MQKNEHLVSFLSNTKLFTIYKFTNKYQIWLHMIWKLLYAWTCNLINDEYLLYTLLIFAQFFELSNKIFQKRQLKK